MRLSTFAFRLSPISQAWQSCSLLDGRVCWNTVPSRDRASPRSADGRSCGGPLRSSRPGVRAELRIGLALGVGIVSVLAGDAHGAVRVPADAAPWVVIGEEDDQEFGSVITFGGDLDGQGEGDLVVGAPGTGQGAGRVWVVRGESTLTPSTALVHDVGFPLDGPPGSRFGSSVLAGDWNDDRLADLAIGAPGAGFSDSGQVFVLLGHPGGMGPGELGEAMEFSPGQAGAHAGLQLAAAGDLDGDGAEDFVSLFVEEGGPGVLPLGVKLHEGGLVLEPIGPALSLPACSVAAWTCAETSKLLGLGDSDGDGAFEFIVGVPGATGPGDEDASGVVLRLVALPSALGVASIAWSPDGLPVSDGARFGGVVAEASALGGSWMGSLRRGGWQLDIGSGPGEGLLGTIRGPEGYSERLAVDGASLDGPILSLAAATAPRRGSAGEAEPEAGAVSLFKLASSLPRRWTDADVRVEGEAGDHLGHTVTFLPAIGGARQEMLLGAPMAFGSGGVFWFKIEDLFDAQGGEGGQHGGEGGSPPSPEPSATMEFELAGDPVLPDAAPGSIVGLDMAWSSQSTFTLDGEEVAALLPTAAGDEVVLDGQFQHVVPFDLPAGRGDFGPSVQLAFARGAEHGYLGLHWVIEGIDSIDRVGPTGGLATGDATIDRFLADGDYLVEVGTGAPGAPRQFRTRFQTDVLYTWDQASDSWDVTRGGLTLRYGAIVGLCGAKEAGRVVTDGENTQVSQRWWLCSRGDAHGNSVLYDYRDEGGWIIPDHVGWGQDHLAQASLGPDPLEPLADRDFVLSFNYLPRPDPRMVADVGAGPDGLGGFDLHDLLLSTIVLEGGPSSSVRSPIRTWTFAHLQAEPSGHSLLHTVGVLGAPAAGGSDASLRLREFRYRTDLDPSDDTPPAPSAPPFQSGPQWSDPISITAGMPDPGEWTAIPARVNHDALPDLLFFSIAARWNVVGDAPICAPGYTECSTPPGCALGTLPDCFDGNSPSFESICDTPLAVRVFVQQGPLDFVEDTVAGAVLQQWADHQGHPDVGLDDLLARIQVVDLNNDGMDDLIGPGGTLLSWPRGDWRSLSTWVQTHGDVPMTPWTDFPNDVESALSVDIASVRFADIDGDGRLDLLRPLMGEVIEVDGPTAEGPFAVSDVEAGGVGGICILPPEGGPRWEAWLNRSAGSHVEFSSPVNPRLPFAGDGAPAPIPSTVLRQPMGLKGPLLQNSCEFDQRTGTYLSSLVLATLDTRWGAPFTAKTGWSWLADNLQLADVNGDGCADASVTIETQPLVDLWNITSPGKTVADVGLTQERPGYYSEVFYGDCRGGFLPTEAVGADKAFLGWPAGRTRSAPQVQRSCGDLPFNGLPLAQACGDPIEPQPWVMLGCETDLSFSFCCTECGQAYAGCWDNGYDLWACPPGPGYPSLPPVPSTSVPPGYPEPWDPMLRHRFARGEEDRLPGNSVAGVVGGIWADIDSDGQVEWVQGCTSPGSPDPLGAPTAEGNPEGVPPGGTPGAAENYPLSFQFARSWNEIGGGPWGSCDGSVAREAGIEYVGSVATPRGMRAPRLGSDHSSLLIDMDGDSFLDSLVVEAGVWAVRRQLRGAPELSLESITYPSGLYPDATSWLAWRSGSPLENPLLPYADVGIAEVVDRNGHRVWQRAGCRIVDGRWTGCGVVAEEDHRGARRGTLYSTRGDLPAFPWLDATWEADGQLHSVRVRLPASADGEMADNTEPTFDPLWRQCRFEAGDGPHDGSLESFLTRCIGFSSPYVPTPVWYLLKRHELLGQAAWSWPNQAGYLGTGILWPGGPEDLSPAPPGSDVFFVDESLWDDTTSQSIAAFAEGYANTPVDDLRVSFQWSSVPPLDPHGPQLDGIVKSDGPATQVFEEESYAYSNWTRTENRRVGGAFGDRVETRALDSFGRPLSKDDADGVTTSFEWNWCGSGSRTEGALGHWTEVGHDGACGSSGSVDWRGLSSTTVRDGFGETVGRVEEPGQGQPTKVSWGSADRDLAGFGDPGRPQRVWTDSRTQRREFRNQRDEVVRVVTCALDAATSPGPADWGAAVDFDCQPGTEVETTTLYEPDGLVFAQSEPHPAGSAARWTRYSYDSLRRVTAAVPVLGTQDQVTGASPGAQMLAPAMVQWFADGEGIADPQAGYLRRSTDPLEDTTTRNGVPVSMTAFRADGRPLAHFDAFARVTSWTYDPWNRAQGVVAPPYSGATTDGQPAWVTPQESWVLSPTGRKIHHSDGTGAAWQWEYDALGRETHAFRPDQSLVAETVYNDVLGEVAHVDGEGGTVIDRLDGLGRTVSRTLPAGLSETIDYDAFGGIAETTDTRSIPTALAWTWLPGGIRREDSTFADGSVARRFVDVGDRVLRTVDRDGVGRDMEWDGWGRPIRTRRGAPGGTTLIDYPSGTVEVELGWDDASRLVWRCPYGVSSGVRCTGYVYDAAGRVSAIHEGLDLASSTWLGEWTLTWRDDDQIETTLDPIGRLTEYIYDEAGHNTEVLVDGVSTGQVLFDALGRPTRMVDADGSILRRSYNDRRELTALFEPGHLDPATFGYDDAGRVRWAENGDGQVNPNLPLPADRWFDYDALGRSQSLIERSGLVRSFEYDGAWLQATQASDGSGNALSRSEYDWDPTTGRMASATVAITEACAQVGATGVGMAMSCAPGEFGQTSVASTPGNRRLAVTDPLGNQHNWTWDLPVVPGAPATGRLLDSSSPTSESHFEYDTLGRLKRVLRGPVVSPLAQTILHRDDLDRLDKTQWLEGSQDEVVQHAFDPMGRIRSSEARRNSQAAEQLYFDYDALDRVTEVVQGVGPNPPSGVPWNGAWDPGELGFQRDPAGNLLHVQYPDGRDVSMSYQDGNLLAAWEGPSATPVNPFYEVAQVDSMGRATQIMRSGFVVETRSYTPEGRIDVLQTDQYAPLGTPGPSPDTVVEAHGYDLFGRMVSRETESLGVRPLGDLSGLQAWAYNAAGWLSSETIDGDAWVQSFDAAGNRLSRLDSGGGGFVATYGADNRMATVDRGAGVQTFQYDDLGRRVNDEDGRSLIYSPRGRLERVLDSNGQVEAAFKFGVFGQRVSEEAAGASRSFIWAPGSMEPWVARDSGGDIDRVIVQGEVVAELEPGQHAAGVWEDGLGGVGQRWDPSGQSDWQARWDAYGNVVVDGGAEPLTAWRGLLRSMADVPYLSAYARDYDPTTGTWLQADPLGVDGDINLYRYAEGDPVNLDDPTGLCVDVEAWQLRAQEAMREHTNDRMGGGKNNKFWQQQYEELRARHVKWGMTQMFPKENQPRMVQPWGDRVPYQDGRPMPFAEGIEDGDIDWDSSDDWEDWVASNGMVDYRSEANTFATHVVFDTDTVVTAFLGSGASDSSASQDVGDPPLGATWLQWSGDEPGGGEDDNGWNVERLWNVALLTPEAAAAEAGLMAPARRGLLAAAGRGLAWAGPKLVGLFRFVGKVPLTIFLDMQSDQPDYSLRDREQQGPHVDPPIDQGPVRASTDDEWLREEYNRIRRKESRGEELSGAERAAKLNWENRAAELGADPEICRVQGGTAGADGKVGEGDGSEASKGGVNPLGATRYTDKVKAQMRPNLKTGRPDNHGFPLEVDNSAGLGRQSKITGGDGVVRTKIELDGSYGGKDGVFEWIIEPDGAVNHRLFRPGGSP